MPDVTATRPMTRRQYERFLRDAGFPRRLCLRLAAAWPSDPDELEPADDDGAGELLKALGSLTSAMEGSE